MPDYTPVNNVNFSTLTLTASAVIAGGQLLTASGSGTVAPSTTGDHSIGIALHDAPSGGRVTLAMLPNVVHEIVVAAAVTAGSPVIAGVTGQGNTGVLATVAGAGTLIGIYLTTQATIGQKARFLGI